MSKKDIDQSFFVTFCIEQFKTKKGIRGEDVAEMFFKTGVADYLNDNYEVLHTQSSQWLMEEISERLNNQK